MKREFEFSGLENKEIFDKMENSLKALNIAKNIVINFDEKKISIEDDVVNGKVLDKLQEEILKLDKNCFILYPGNPFYREEKVNPKYKIKLEEGRNFVSFLIGVVIFVLGYHIMEDLEWQPVSSIYNGFIYFSFLLIGIDVFIDGVKDIFKKNFFSNNVITTTCAFISVWFGFVVEITIALILFKVFRFCQKYTIKFFNCGIDANQNEQLGLQKFITTLRKYYTPIVLIIGIAMFFLNYYAFGKGYNDSIKLCIYVCLLSCSEIFDFCTSYIPYLNIKNLRSKGVDTKDISFFENFRTTKTFVFDKNVLFKNNKCSLKFSLFESNEDELTLKRICKSLSLKSSKPDLIDIVNEFSEFEEIALINIQENKNGSIEGIFNNHKYSIVSHKESKNLNEDFDFIDSNIISNSIYIMRDDCLIGKIDFVETLTNEAKTIIKYFVEKKKNITIVSNTKNASTKSISKTYGIDFYSNIETLHRIEDSTNKICFIGDENSDKNLFDTANISILISEDSNKMKASAYCKKLEDILKIDKEVETFCSIGLMNIAWTIVVRLFIFILLILSIFNLATINIYDIFLIDIKMIFVYFVSTVLYFALQKKRA